MTLELEIVSNDLNIRRAVVLFTQKRCVPSYRDIALDFLLDEKSTSLDEILVESSADKPILGSTYQSSLRDQVSLKDVSHVISSIRISKNNIYAIVRILDTPSGKSMKKCLSDNSNRSVRCAAMFPNRNTQMVLKPVYRSDGTISTFDIDITINNQAA